MPNVSLVRANTVYHRLSKWCTDKSILSLASKSWLSRNDRKALHKTSRHLPC